MTKEYGANKTNRSVCLAIMANGSMPTEKFHLLSEEERNAMQFQIFRPHIGAQRRLETFEEIKNKGVLFPSDLAQNY